MRMSLTGHNCEDVVDWSVLVYVVGTGLSKRGGLNDARNLTSHRSVCRGTRSWYQVRLVYWMRTGNGRISLLMRVWEEGASALVNPTRRQRNLVGSHQLEEPNHTGYVEPRMGLTL